MTDTRRDNLRGIAFMVGAMVAFSLMDAALKVLSPHYPPLQVAAMRGMATVPLALAWASVDGGLGQLLRVRWGLHALRAVMGIAMLALFAWALRELPLADAYAIVFVAPLMITALAVPLLKEHVDARRWAAIGVGFLGVLVVLRPGGGGAALSMAGLAVLVAAAMYALSAIMVRVLGRTDTTQSMVFWLMFMVSVGAGLMALPNWAAIRPEHWSVLGGLAVTGTIGQYCVTEAFRRGQASVIAPFEYTGLAWALTLDWVLWHTAPGTRMLVGAAIIIGSGLYLIRRERTHLEAEHP
jgi:drug/metabolite transporter (DMT)-like permease